MKHMIRSTYDKIEYYHGIIDKIEKLNVEVPEAFDKIEKYFNSKDFMEMKKRMEKTRKGDKLEVYDAFEVAHNFLKGTKIPLHEAKKIFLDNKKIFIVREEIDSAMLAKKLGDILDRKAQNNEFEFEEESEMD